MTKYFEHNRLWMSPVIAGLMIAIGPALLQVIGGPDASPLPAWLPFLGLAIAGFGAGIGATFTHTTSANVVRFVGTAAGFAVLLLSIFK